MESVIQTVRRSVMKPKPSVNVLQAANGARDAKDYSEAARLYAAYLASHPLDAAIHIQCGHMNKELGRLEEAGRHYYIAYALLPNDTDLQVQLGHYQKVSGKLDEAISFYKRATELSPDNADAKRELSRALAMATAPHLRQPAGRVLEIEGTGAITSSSAFAGKTAEARSRDSAAAYSSRLESREAILGYFDSFEEGIAQGWAYDANKPQEVVTLIVSVDGRDVATVPCNRRRDDVRINLAHPTGDVGFRYETPLAYFDGKSHTIGFRSQRQTAVCFMEGGRPENARETLEFAGKLPAKIHGVVDGLYQGHLQGWAVRKEPRSKSAHGGCTIVVTCNGIRVAQARADRFRGDVANSLKSDPNCGFRIQIPDAFRKAYPQTFRLHVMPGNVELQHSPYTTTVLYDHLEATFAEVSSTIDRLYHEVAALRNYASKLRVRPCQTIEDYDGWARAYYTDLRERVLSSRCVSSPGLTQSYSPLVSVLVPTFKPLLSDFSSAIRSVIDQTYQNWELIIVDDASNDPQLAALIAKFCQEDGRVKAITRADNGNISEATNTAIAAARGEWVAFFDHDDLLVDVAIEVMVAHALKSGATVLYSDEDKIDQAGYFSDPALKPDWNHRFVLGCNYVCHLLFVRKELLSQVGPLRTKYNGAQDHDLVLRISEHVPASMIHHVPELLYHWRKTPNSTAVTIANKDYAVKAGVAAVADHLERIGKDALVRAIDDLTIYKVEWLYKAYPRVCIIIPFKDHVEMTRLCLDRLLAHTTWPGLEVIFVNNWSITEEANDFTSEVAKLPGFRVIDVEEEFNYSRLNNIAAAKTSADYLVFMNNDLLVGQDDWLRILVNEALADGQVGIVGSKLVYPTGSIQHAGLVVGAPEIAAYLHHGISPQEYGYLGRAILTHELTAVTAACMLIRADVFRAVGGFDEIKLKVAYNDVDLCLKVRSAGKKVIFAAECVAEHHESYSRGTDDRPEHEMRFLQERQVMIDRWGDLPIFKEDPAYNRNFEAGGRKFFDLAALQNTVGGGVAVPQTSFGPKSID
jgi:glycosyltransferase involved in cell wall biosynthesis/tetratricopeptide (TPR) repeat protein